MRRITIRSVRTWPWVKTRRWVGQSSGPAPLSPSQSCPACTTITSGYDFRKGQDAYRDGGEDGRQYHLPGHFAHQHDVDENADGEAEHNRRSDRADGMISKQRGSRVEEIGAEHRQFAVRHVHHAAYAIDEYVAAGEQRIDRGENSDVDDELHGLLQAGTNCDRDPRPRGELHLSPLAARGRRRAQLSEATRGRSNEQLCCSFRRIAAAMQHYREA